MAQAQGYESIARIADERNACIADQSDLRALFHGHHQLWRARQLVVFVITHKRLLNVVVGQKFLRMAGILTRDLVHFF